MKPRLSDLWRWDGAIDRGACLLWGLMLLLGSDLIIHAIHRRVLNHVKTLAEGGEP